jgi:hypothetical protein
VIALVCSRRETAKLLRLDRNPGGAIDELVQRGDLVEVPWGRTRRITLESIQGLARRGFTLDGKRPRPASRPRRSAPAPGVGARIRALEVDP